MVEAKSHKKLDIKDSTSLRKLSLLVLKSMSMTVTMSFLDPLEQLYTQQICIWFYKTGTGRI